MLLHVHAVSASIQHQYDVQTFGQMDGWMDGWMSDYVTEKHMNEWCRVHSQ